ncbi:MAG: DUF6379 domain-containing protein [Lachnospiraceae bacterium]|jgi:hypothetical protein|nr:DUF6379 domain-containing protein [Lachnospiraceae bacterium]
MKADLEERMKTAKESCRESMLMTKPLKPGTCRNRTIGDCCTGYEFQIDNLSYRGIWISTIEDITLTVDGAEVPKSHMMFFCNGIGYSVADMVTHTENFWGCMDPGILRVYRVGGLPAGDHEFRIRILKRADFGHSYGEGTQGYEKASEFLTPMVIEDSCVYTI